MAKIKVMNEQLANMIAAGEVVDRPASVLKELVENAIDADATKITIEIKDFGMSLIKVIDNGSGMDIEDAKMAFLRHATSKIMKEEDLSEIKSLGFRGEALAAISSVSNITLETKTKDNDGILLEISASKVIKEQVIATNNGTSVSVKDLFFNVPARFKYIKSEYAEKQQIIDLFERLALANPNISMTLIYDNKVIKETYGNNDISQTFAQIYGPTILKDLTIIDDYFQKTSIKIYLASPNINKPRKKDIHIILNNRNIRNYLLTQSIIDGYQTLLMTNRYPVALLYIDIDFKLVDVNVHPQKYEVKLQNEQILAFHIKELIKSHLTKRKQSIFSKVDDVLKPKVESYEKVSIFDDNILEFDNHQLVKEESFVDLEKLPQFDYIGQLAGTYLLFQNDEGMFLIDQHAAEERIRYEYYINKLTTNDFVSIPRLIAYNLYLTDNMKSTIKRNINSIEKIGFKFDDNLNIIESPLWIRDEEIEYAIEIIIAKLEETNTFSLIDLRDDLAKDISCKGAIKANHKLNLNEINQLIKDLRNSENPYSCPHGRPVTIKITLKDIERMFKRIV